MTGATSASASDPSAGRRATVGVIGVGTVGAMTLWQLARRGVDVVGIDRFVPGHGNGAHGGETRLYRVGSEGPGSVPVTRAALDDWRLLERDTGMDLLDLNGELHVGEADSPLIARVLANAQEFGLAVEPLTPAAVRERFPTVPIRDDQIAVFERDCGYVKAGSSVVAATDAAVHAGARLVTGTVVSAITPVDDGVLVVTDDGEWHFGSVVVATGAWANELLRDRLPRFDIRRANVQWYPLRTPVGYTPDVYPIVERDDVSPGFAIWPTLDGDTIKVGYMAALDRIDGPGDFSSDVDEAIVALMDDYVARFIPDAIPVCVKHVYGQDACTADGDFVLGPLPGEPRIVTALGMNLRGFKMCPAIGRAAADWAVDGATAVPLPPLTAARFRGVPTLS